MDKGVVTYDGLQDLIQDFFNASLKLFFFDRGLSRFTVPAAYSVRSSVTSCRIKFPA